MFFENQIVSIQKKISETNDEALLASLHANLESVQKAGKKSVVDLTTGESCCFSSVKTVSK